MNSTHQIQLTKNVEDKLESISFYLPGCLDAENFCVKSNGLAVIARLEKIPISSYTSQEALSFAVIALLAEGFSIMKCALA